MKRPAGVALTGESEKSTFHARISILALNPRVDLTRIQKHEYQQKELSSPSPEYFFKKIEAPKD